MTRFLLVRHAPVAGQGAWLTGRAEVPVDPTERWRVVRLADRLAAEPVTEIQSSPRLRCRETAAVIGGRLGLPVRPAEALDEIAYGVWTGRSIAELEPDPLWRRWNSWRSGTVPPDGESMAQAQIRLVSYMERLAATKPDGTIVLVSHGDPIRAALCFWLGIPLDLMQRLELAPASVSCMSLHAWGPSIESINETVLAGGGA